jgi:hypothetical protein
MTENYAHRAPAPSHAPDVIYIPEPLTRVEAHDILAAAAAAKEDAGFAELLRLSTLSGA